MAFNYTQAQKTARKLIGGFGTSVPFYQITGGTLDPVTGQKTGTSTTSETVKVAALPISSGKNMFDNETFEELVKTESRFVYAEINTNGYEPKDGHLVQFESKIWEVKGVSSLNPTGAKVVLYMVGLKLSGRSVIP